MSSHLEVFASALGNETGISVIAIISVLGVFRFHFFLRRFRRVMRYAICAAGQSLPQALLWGQELISQAGPVSVPGSAGQE